MRGMVVIALGKGGMGVRDKILGMEFSLILPNSSRARVNSETVAFGNRAGQTIHRWRNRLLSAGE